MTEQEKRFYIADRNLKPHPKQRELFFSDARFKVVVAGRRFGKTYYTAFFEILPRLFTKNTRTWIVAPTYTLADKAFREVAAYVKAYPAMIEAIREREQYIRTPWNATLEGKSAENPISLVGEGLDLLVVDECGAIRDDVYYEYLRPTLSDREGKGVFISTPKGKNWFHRMYVLGTEGKNGIESFHFTSYDNIFLRREEIESAKEEVPPYIFAQEYLARFVERGNTLFTGLSACVTSSYRAAHKGERVAVGCDLARKHDYTVLVALSSKTGEMIAFSRFHHISWHDQIRAIKAFTAKYDEYTLYLDATGVGDAILDSVEREGVHVEGVCFTNARKRALVEHLALLIEQQRIRLVDEPVLIDELRAFTLSYTKGGNVRYEGEGAHDDCVMALALAARGVGYDAGEDVLSVIAR